MALLYDPAGGGGGGGGAMVRLFDSTLGADAATIDTGAAGVPAGYAALLITLYVRTADASAVAACFLRFNNDSGSNYGYSEIRNNNGAAATVQTASDTGIEVQSNGSGATANVYSAGNFTVPAYDNTSNRKAVTGTCGFMDSASFNQSATTVGVWKNNGAITRAALVAESGANLKAGSRMTIWGLN